MSYKFSTQTERTNQSLHDELIAKAEAMIPVLRERSNLRTVTEGFLKKQFKILKKLAFLNTNQKNMVDKS